MGLFGNLDVRLEPWDVEYGSEAPFEAPLETTDEDVALDIEVPDDEWQAVRPAPAEAPERLVFVDGVRRVEARLIVRRNGSVCRGAFGSYAVGCTVVAGGRAEIGAVRVHRLIVLGSGEVLSDTVEVMPGLEYQPESTDSSEVDGPLQHIQQRMRTGEERLARELADDANTLVVIDGPLTFGEKAQGEAVGYVKRLHQLYIDRGARPEEKMNLLFELPEGMRTPLFALRSSRRFARYCWFLRLSEPYRGESPLSGLVRLEVSEAVGVQVARCLADATAAALPGFAPARARDRVLPKTFCPSGLWNLNCDGGSGTRVSYADISARCLRERPFMLNKDSKEAPFESEPVGLVLGSMDATPLEFWIGVEKDRRVQLDDLIVVETVAPGGDRIYFYGVVDMVRKRYEGAQFDSDAFRAAEGTLPVDVSYAAHVQVTRIDPEIFLPPHPGDRVLVVRGEDFQRALYFDQMERRVAIGRTRTGEPVYANLDFLDGTRGAHASISGVSGVATKTSYATFLLYSIFHSEGMGADAINSKALIFNVKGEDLLWLDKPNRRLSARDRSDYDRLGLPAGPFRSVGLFAPTTPRSKVPMPDTGGRQEGVRPYLWTLKEFARDRLLRFAFAEAEDARAQLSFVIYRVENALARAVAKANPEDPAIEIDDERIESFSDLVSLLDDEPLERMVPRNVASGTLDAFRRRLHAAAQHMGHLVRGDAGARGFGINWEEQQVTVVDIHKLHSTAQMFVVGVLLRRMMDRKASQGTSRPLVFVVLDELNKYAPREGWSPIGEVLLDIAERGRSLGVSLFGAQQTASEVERRVVANTALKVVGRLDAAEAERAEYGFLTRVARVRAKMLQPGTMIVAQPEIPTPILLRFPFPAWATRQSEAASEGTAVDPFERFDDG